MNEELVIDDSIGSLPFDSLSGLLLTVVVVLVLVVVVVVVVVAVVPSKINKMKSIVMLSRLFLTSFIKPEVHNVTYVFKKFLLTTFPVRQYHCIFQFTAGF